MNIHRHFIDLLVHCGHIQRLPRVLRSSCLLRFQHWSADGGKANAVPKHSHGRGPIIMATTQKQFQYRKATHWRLFGISSVFAEVSSDKQHLTLSSWVPAPWFGG